MFGLVAWTTISAESLIGRGVRAKPSMLETLLPPFSRISRSSRHSGRNASLVEEPARRIG